MLALHETCEVKQRAGPYLRGRLVSETRPDNGHSTIVTNLIAGHKTTEQKLL